MCATVQGQCLEYLVYITLALSSKCTTQKSRHQFVSVTPSCLSSVVYAFLGAPFFELKLKTPSGVNLAKKEIPTRGHPLTWFSLLRIPLLQFLAYVHASRFQGDIVYGRPLTKFIKFWRTSVFQSSVPISSKMKLTSAEYGLLARHMYVWARPYLADHYKDAWLLELPFE